MKLPKLTQAPVEFVDATPDDDLPVRILKVYRDNYSCNWETTDSDPSPIWATMNKHNEERVKILNKAINKLQGVD